ncbi:protein of unknown function DUF630 [Cynara cardunculus var. scolymus]|uniref:DUF632 domain-containing protein n=1 Tax=Cynara cardunculus var. scolymus TaxID=59895 RepID=A0A118INH5_CYNCS|nr:protein of unknown function DUF630 [Cynara cardunculus var. scolymus]
MGCSSSKLDDEEAVQLCKDRKNFIKKAVEHRTRFASGHMAYLRSLKRLSAALKDYVEGDEPREFSLDSFTTPLVPTTKKITQRFVTISPNSFTIEPKVNYLRAGGVNPTVFVQERPPGSPETVRVESFNQSSVYQYATDSFFPMQPQSPPLSIFHSSRPNLPPPSPQRSSQWDFFWNPFSSLDYYGYPATNSDHQSVFDDDINGLQQVREEEGIPELEEETEQEETDNHRVIRRAKVHVNCDHEDEVTVEDVDDDDEFETDGGDETETEHEAESPPLTNKSQNLEVSKAQNLGEVSNNGTAEVVSNQESAKIEGTPGFTVYVNRRPTSMSEILNPVALLRSASSSRSNSSRFLMNSSGISKDEGYASSSDLSDESTYEKKCVQLRNHDIKGDDYSSVHKTRTAIRDLHTQIKVSIHSVEAVSKRIETLMDQELQPQLLELIQGLSRMWKVMAECHQNQKRTLDEAKMLLAGTPSKPKYTPIHSSEPHRLSRSASNLEAELQNWKSCFESWITSQRSYIHAITGWLLRCTGSNSNNTSKFPFSPRRSTGGPPMFGACMQWSRLLDSISEVPVLDGLDFFAAGVGSLYVQKLKEGGGGGSGRTEIGSSRRYGGGSGMEMVESGRPEEEETAEKMAEVAIKVLCAGMSVVVSSLTEFALCSAQGYSDLVKQWESAKCPEGNHSSYQKRTKHNKMSTYFPRIERGRRQSGLQAESREIEDRES